MKSAIVFGASGFIGAALLAHLRERSWDALGTHFHHPRPGLLKFSFPSDSLREKIGGGGRYRYGIICGGITGIDRCKQEFALSQRINVAGVLGLIEEFASLGITPVFLSSDYVFDGARGGYGECDETSPITVYGRQKVFVEEHLLRDDSDALVVRLSKVFGLDPKDGTILSEWSRAIARQERIRCAGDQWFSPTWIGDVVSGLRRLLEERASGIYHLCHPRRLNRSTMLIEFGDAIGRTLRCVDICKTSEFGFADNRGADTSLSPEKFIDATGYSFAEHGDCFRHYWRALAALSNAGRSATSSLA